MILTSGSRLSEELNLEPPLTELGKARNHLMSISLLVLPSLNETARDTRESSLACSESAKEPLAIEGIGMTEPTQC